MNRKVNSYNVSLVKMLRLEKDVPEWEHVISVKMSKSRPTIVNNVEQDSVLHVVLLIRRHATAANQKAVVVVLLDS